MKGGCIVTLAIGFAIVVLGTIVFGLLNLGWFEERFGQMGMAFFLGFIVLMIVVFSTMALMGAIVFGLSGLWVNANSNSGVMMGTMAESIASILRYSRLPAGNGQSGQKNAPIFPQMEYGARPGQAALAEGMPPYGGFGQGTTPENQIPTDPRWTGADTGRGHGEVIAR